MSIDYEAVGLRIKASRTRCGLTQEKLAERINLSTSYVSKLETAESKPSLQAIVDIANALNTSVDALLSDSVTYPSVYLQKDFEEILEDATPEELKIFRETIRSLKTSLRAFRRNDD